MLFKLLIVTAFLNGLSWIILIPVWQYPDEQAHFAQVQNIAEIGGSPIEGPDTSVEIAFSETLLGTERDSMGNNRYTYNPYYHIKYTNSSEGYFEELINNLPKETRYQMYKREATHNPPLYHKSASNFYKIFAKNGLFARVYVVRFFSLILYLCLIIICINASKLIFKHREIEALTLTTLMAFTPMLVFSTTGVLPDSLTILLFTIIFTMALKIIKTNLSLSGLILLSTVIYLGTKTRQQFQVAIPIALLPVAYALLKRLPGKKFSTIPIGLSFIVGVFVLALIPVAYNLSIFSIPEIRTPNLSLLFTNQFAGYLVSTLKQYYSQTLPWYWGVYKWLSLSVPHVYYQIINRAIALALIGLIIWIVITIKNKKVNKQDLMINTFIASIFIYMSTFIIWDFYFQKIYGYPFGIQGRYFLPLILPITTVLFFGLKNLLQLFIKRYLYIVYFLLTFAMILFNDISLAYVSSTYYDGESIKMLISQISQYKPFIFKGYIIQIIISLTILSQIIYLYNLSMYFKKNNESR